MEHERPHRSISAVEVGISDIGANHGRHPTAHAATPQWLINWETSRPRWLTECLAEMVGVFFYVAFGIGANMAFNLANIAKLTGFGSLLNTALAYGFGIAFGILVAGPVSGSHLSPGYTIAFATFKGFPWRKVPQYIFFQILGAYLAALLVYAQYGEQARAVNAGLRAVGQYDAINFSPFGVAGALAIFPTAGQDLGLVFLNELVATTLLAILVFSVLDISNLFIAFHSAPFLIGLAYTAVILAFAVDTVVLNTARDLGGRFACGSIFGTQCFPMQYSALAALTNILGSLLGAAIQTFLLGDHRRPLVNMPPSGALPDHGAKPLPGHSSGVSTGTSTGLHQRDVRSDAPYEKTANGNGNINTPNSVIHGSNNV